MWLAIRWDVTGGVGDVAWTRDPAASVSGGAVAVLPALVLALVVARVAASGEGLRISLHLSRARLAYGQQAVLSVVMRTGGSAQTVGVGVLDGGWPDADVSGSPVAVSDEALAGPGRITGCFSSGGMSIDPYSMLCACGAVRLDGGGNVNLALPADSTTTLSYMVGFAAMPWQGMTAQIGVSTHQPSLDPLDHGITRQLTQRLIATGTPGIRITLTAPTSRPGEHGDRTVPAHQLLRILGATQPALPGTAIDLASTLNGPELAKHTQPIATARTDRNGRFHSSWRPRSPGIYVLQATAPQPPAPYTRDHGCGLKITAR